MDLSDRDLEGIIRYAKAQCESKCPSDRDPEICLALIELCRCLNSEVPSCFMETEGFSKNYFMAKVREIERRRGKKIQEVIADMENRGVRTLEDQIDRMDGEFALKALRALDKRAKAKGEGKTRA